MNKTSKKNGYGLKDASDDTGESPDAVRAAWDQAREDCYGCGEKSKGSNSGNKPHGDKKKKTSG